MSLSGPIIQSESVSRYLKNLIRSNLSRKNIIKNGLLVVHLRMYSRLYFLITLYNNYYSEYMFYNCIKFASCKNKVMVRILALHCLLYRVQTKLKLNLSF